jgi:hypothetical protein
MLLAWLAYRQYFPPLERADGGRPYSIAEFATSKTDRPAAAYSTANAFPPEQDLELGQTRHRLPRGDTYRDADEEASSPTKSSPRGYGPGEGSHSFEANTSYQQQ